MAHLHRVGRAARAGRAGRATNLYDDGAADLVASVRGASDGDGGATTTGAGDGDVSASFSRRRGFRAKVGSPFPSLGGRVR